VQRAAPTWRSRRALTSSNAFSSRSSCSVAFCRGWGRGHPVEKRGVGSGQQEAGGSKEGEREEGSSSGKEACTGSSTQGGL
jgi:hypothetical protein